MADKPKLSVSAQIQQMKKRDIKFSLISENGARESLQKANNYFKLTAYRKSFTLNADDKYEDLDFAHLKNLSKIDMHLRYCLLEMCLDIEHFGKAKLMNYITDQKEEDGYSIVQEHIKSLSKPDNIVPLVDNLEIEPLPKMYREAYNKAEYSEYLSDLYNKHKDNMPIWAVIEILSFRGFVNLYMFFCIKYGYKRGVDEGYMMITIGKLRNACAHNNCIINDLSAPPPSNPPNEVTAALRRFMKTAEMNSALDNSRIIQITTLLYLHQDFVKTGLRDYQKERLQMLKDKMNEHPSYYANCPRIIKFFDFFNLLIDKWF